MSERDFCYWLQGYFEIVGWNNLGGLTPEQEQCIRKRMDLVRANDTTGVLLSFIDGVLETGGDSIARVICVRLKLHFERVIDKAGTVQS